MRLKALLAVIALATTATSAAAQTPAQTSGTLVIVPAYAEVKQANDEAHVVFSIEEQDRDKVLAASRANQKMKQGVEILKREDPLGVLQTRGYYTYPVYADEQPRPVGKQRQIIGWRVGQYLDMKTSAVERLPKTVAAAQKILSLNGVQFGLSEAATKKLDAKRIEAAYGNLGERIAAIAKAMGRNPAEAVIETVDFEASGAYAQNEAVAPRAAMFAAGAESKVQVEEPNFEPGESILRMQVVGKVRFK